MSIFVTLACRTTGCLAEINAGDPPEIYRIDGGHTPCYWFVEIKEGQRLRGCTVQVTCPDGDKDVDLYNGDWDRLDASYYTKEEFDNMGCNGQIGGSNVVPAPPATCPDNQIVLSGECRSCPAGEIADIEKNSCKPCSAGQIAVDNQCQTSDAGGAGGTEGASGAEDANPPVADEAPTMTKTANPTTFSAAGQTITYTYEIANPGSKSLNADSVKDDKAKVSCPATTIAPKSSMTCTSTYVTTKEDVANGSVTNTASYGDSSGNQLTASATIALVQPILQGTVSYCYPAKDMSYINLPFNPQTNPKDVQTGLSNGSLAVQIGDVKGACTVDFSNRLTTCAFPTSAFVSPETTINVLRNGTVIDVVKFDNYCPAPSKPKSDGGGEGDDDEDPQPPVDGGGDGGGDPPDTGLD